MDPGWVGDILAVVALGLQIFVIFKKPKNKDDEDKSSRNEASASNDSTKDKDK